MARRAECGKAPPGKRFGAKPGCTNAQAPTSTRNRAPRALRRSRELIWQSCPESGKFLAFGSQIWSFSLMSELTEFEDLVAYLVRTSRLSRPEATRFVDEVLS